MASQIDHVAVVDEMETAVLNQKEGEAEMEENLEMEKEKIEQDFCLESTLKRFYNTFNFLPTFRLYSGVQRVAFPYRLYSITFDKGLPKSARSEAWRLLELQVWRMCLIIYYCMDIAY